MDTKGNINDNLSELFSKWSKRKAEEIIPLPESGSIRKYFLIKSGNTSAIGTYNPDKRENNAFLSLSWHFASHHLNVPQIYLTDSGNDIYIQQYLGDTSLFDFLSKHRKNGRLSDKTIEIYKCVIEELPKFQIIASRDLDFSSCYPRDAFDRQSIMWDMNYFKYYYLKLSGIQFDEQNLENDFNTFADYLLDADCGYFLYRDFQSRNIMLCENKPFFIDYQGGRRGALQYDIASLLYDAKADIPIDTRDLLLKHYMLGLNNFIKYDSNSFLKYYRAYSLVRIMQALGAYGYRGGYEKKQHFLQSIPYALKNIRQLLSEFSSDIKLSELFDSLNKLTSQSTSIQISKNKHKLTVSINSFSYRKPIPSDETGNGGGFVFDCRAIKNPGNDENFKPLTGRDASVKAYLEKEDEMNSFLKNVFALIEQSVDKYLKRSFTNLMVNFGCTGGQHRSVYSAESLYKHLKNKYNGRINLILRHRELELKSKL